MKAYEWSLKDKRDAESIRITTERMVEEGMRKGIEKGKRKVVENLCLLENLLFQRLPTLRLYQTTLLRKSTQN